MDNKIVILIVLSSLLCVMYMCLTTSQKIVENFEGEELGRELEKAMKMLCRIRWKKTRMIWTT